MVLGTLAAAALARASFFGRDAISLLLILPIALPGIITGIALRSAYGTLEIPFSFWTIVIGHATFCVVVVYNNAVARLRRLNPTLIEASMDLGADGFQTVRYVILPQLGTALLAGALLAFALSFDEVIVTTFTAGQQTTLPIWMLQELVRPRQRPVTNVVAVVDHRADLRAHPAAYYLTRADEPRAPLTPAQGDSHDRHRHCPTELLIDGAFVAGEGDAEEASSTRPPAQLLVERARGLRRAGRTRPCRPRTARSTAGARPRRRSVRACCSSSPTRSSRAPRTSRASNRSTAASPMRARSATRSRPIVDCFRFFAGAARCLPRHRRRRVPRRPHQHDPARPDRRGRLDRALELPADDGGVEDRAGAGGRQHRRAQALASRRR